MQESVMNDSVYKMKLYNLATLIEKKKKQASSGHSKA